MKKRRILAQGIAFILVVVTILSGCGQSKVEESTEVVDEVTSEKTVITFWNGFTGPDGAVLEELVKEYNETNDKNIEVEMSIMPWDSLFQKLSTVLAVGEGPDMIAMAPERTGTYAEPGAIAEIGDAYTSGVIDESFVPGSLKENLQYDGEYYGVPMNFATLLLFYNKDIFVEAGLDPEKPPTTWEELEEYAQQIIDNTDKYGFTMASKETTPMWPIMLWGNGGDIISDGKAVFNSDENVEAVTRWAQNIRDKEFGPAILTGGEIDKLFESQKLAMYFCGPWATGGFEGAGINFGVAQAPEGPHMQVTQANGVGLYMTSSSEQKEAVYDFFGWWNSEDVQVKWALGSGFPPTRTDITDDERLAENPYIAEFAKPADASKMYLQQLTNFAEIENRAIIPAFEKILLENADVKATLDEANQQIEELMK